MKLINVVVALVMIFVGTEGVSFGDTLLVDPLAGSTSGNQNGGDFNDDGWQAPQQIWWDLGETLYSGSMSVTVTNWDPNEDSSQHQHEKQHIINMYEAPHGSAWDANNSSPQTAFFNIRTGVTYDNCYKFLSTPAGFQKRKEDRVKKPYGTIQPGGTHTLSVVWTEDGTITSYLDGVAEVTHEHGEPIGLRYVFIGTDNTIPGTYGPQHDVIYSQLVVEGDPSASGEGGNPEPDPDPVPGNPLLVSPIEDTWADPNAPTVVHGASDELRVGGDGRTIYLNFNVIDVGPIGSATLRMTSMNGGYGGDVHVVPDTTWSEDTLNWANRPPHESAVLGTPGFIGIGETIEVDVSSAVQCDGLHAFAIDSNEVDGAGYWSHESNDVGPQLILTPNPGGNECDVVDPEPDPDPDPEPDPDPDPEPDPEEETGEESTTGSDGGEEATETGGEETGEEVSTGGDSTGETGDKLGTGSGDEDSGESTGDSPSAGQWGEPVEDSNGNGGGCQVQHGQDGSRLPLTLLASIAGLVYFRRRRETQRVPRLPRPDSPPWGPVGEPARPRPRG